MPALPPKSRPETVDAADGTALCTACGLCCTGLYTRLRITPEERPLAQAAGPVLDRDGTLHAALPCSYLHGTICSVYTERYAACRRYACKLLRGVLAGEIDRDVADTRIAEMRRLLGAMRRATAIAPVGDRALAETRLAVLGYNLYANKHFRNVPDPAALA